MSATSIQKNVLLKVKNYIDAQENLEQLRFITCGSVDDGKSTLIGRMLFEAQLIYEDQIAAMESDSGKSNSPHGELDLALLVDGLAAEREVQCAQDSVCQQDGPHGRGFLRCS